jgi:hypothetical protein
MKIRFKLVLFFYLLTGLRLVSAQQSKIDMLLAKFDSHRKKSVQEKLYLHTDQDLYLTGETLWFKIYNLEATSHKPLSFSKIAYVELVGENNVNTLQAKIALIDGRGAGSFFIPASMQTGTYTLRAYTEWMKNFPDEYFFYKKMSIINPFVGSETIKQHPRNSVNVNFFPEGGDLVAGLRSKVGFKVTDPNGQGIVCNGVVLNAEGDTLAKFAPLKMGIGHFSITPSEQGSEKIIITDSRRQTFQFDIPKAKPHGYVMSVFDHSADFVRVTVSHNLESTDHRFIHLFIHAKQVVVHAEARQMEGNVATFSVAKKDLREGINHFTVFDSQLNPVSERLYFKFPSEKRRLAMQTSYPGYDVRKKVTLNLFAQADNKVVSANLSIAVFKIDSLATISNPGISEYLWLSSDLSGRIDSAAYYFSDDNQAAEAMDNLMITHGWRRFKWKEVLESNISPNYYPEVRNHIIKGTVKDDDGKPVPGALVYLSSPGKIIQLYPAISDRNGDVKFETNDFYGSRKVIAVTKDTLLRVDIKPPFLPFTNQQGPPTLLLPTMESTLTGRSIGLQVQDIFHQDTRSKFIFPQVDSSAFYGIPDERYALDTYTRFPVMEEVMREYVSGVMVRKKRDQFHFVVLNKQTKGVLTESPLILLDGVPIKNADLIMNFDPLKIKMLDVIMRPYYLGSATIDGIVSYSTYTGDLAGFQFNPETLVVDYEGLQLQREFFSPEYHTEEQRHSRIPDQRHLLYWNADVNTEEQTLIEFFTSDKEGKFIIKAEGLSETGQPITGWTTFNVKRSHN